MFFLLTFFLAPLAVFAQDINAPIDQDSGGDAGGPINDPVVMLDNPLGSTSLNDLISNILGIVVQIGSIVVILMLVYVGFLFVIARGEPGAIIKARQALLYTVIGALILLGAQAISMGITETVKTLSP